MTSAFINLDLTLRGSGVGDLAKALAPEVFVVSDDQDRVTLEVNVDPVSIDALIDRFVSLVEGLPLALRGKWDGLAERSFDVGVRAQPGQAKLTISPQSVARVASVRGQIRLTVYPAEQDG